MNLETMRPNPMTIVFVTTTLALLWAGAFLQTFDLVIKFLFLACKFFLSPVLSVSHPSKHANCIRSTFTHKLSVSNNYT
jgi:hypothetical protein